MKIKNTFILTIKISFLCKTQINTYLLFVKKKSNFIYLKFLQVRPVNRFFIFIPSFWLDSPEGMIHIAYLCTRRRGSIFSQTRNINTAITLPLRKVGFDVFVWAPALTAEHPQFYPRPLLYLSWQLKSFEN